MTAAVAKAVAALIASLLCDEHLHGGLLSRETIRLANELQVLLAAEGIVA
jgi:hypothetical protein